jgi:hypothetical protein
MDLGLGTKAVEKFVCNNRELVITELELKITFIYHFFFRDSTMPTAVLPGAAQRH